MGVVICKEEIIHIIIETETQHDFICQAYFN